MPRASHSTCQTSNDLISLKYLEQLCLRDVALHGVQNVDKFPGWPSTVMTSLDHFWQHLNQHLSLSSPVIVRDSQLVHLFLHLHLFLVFLGQLRFRLHYALQRFRNKLVRVGYLVLQSHVMFCLLDQADHRHLKGIFKRFGLCLEV